MVSFPMNVDRTQVGVLKLTGEFAKAARTVTQYQPSSPRDGLPINVDKAYRQLGLLNDPEIMVYENIDGTFDAYSYPRQVIKRGEEYYMLGYRHYGGSFPLFRRLGESEGFEKINPEEYDIVFRRTEDNVYPINIHAKGEKVSVPDDFDPQKHEYQKTKASNNFTSSVSKRVMN